MLTTSRTSRRRLAAGTVSVGLLVTAGLGLTASGTSAAEAIGARIQTDAPAMPFMASMAAMESMPQLAAVPPVAPVPPMPPMASLPAVDPVPPVPPVPPVKAVNAGTRTNVLHIRNDTWRKGAGVPEVSERNCTDGRDGDVKQLVVNRQDGDRRIMLVCTNRIEKAAADAAQLAVNSKDIERNALRHAITGLRSARAGVAGNMSMSAEQRAQALAGIDQGIAEVESDIAKVD